jgi:hypothetical protein
MGTEANTAEQASTETTPEQVDALLEVQHQFHYFWFNLFELHKIALLVSLSLSQAARYDDLDDVVSLAAAGVPLDSKDSLGRTGYNLKLLLLCFSLLWFNRQQCLWREETCDFYCVKIEKIFASKKEF